MLISNYHRTASNQHENRIDKTERALALDVVSWVDRGTDHSSESEPKQPPYWDFPEFVGVDEEV